MSTRGGFSSSAQTTTPQHSLAVCRPGYGGPGCNTCDLGTFSLGGNASVAAPTCVPCPITRTTLITGATECSGIQRWLTTEHDTTVMKYVLWAHNTNPKQPPHAARPPETCSSQFAAPATVALAATPVRLAHFRSVETSVRQRQHVCSALATSLRCPQPPRTAACAQVFRGPVWKDGESGYANKGASTYSLVVGVIRAQLPVNKTKAHQPNTARHRVVLKHDAADDAINPNTPPRHSSSQCAGPALAGLAVSNVRLARSRWVATSRRQRPRACRALTTPPR